MRRGRPKMSTHGSWCNDRRDGSTLAALDAEAAMLHSAGRVHVREVSAGGVSGSVFDSDDRPHHVRFTFPAPVRWTCSCGSKGLCIGIHALVRLTTQPLTPEVAA